MPLGSSGAHVGPGFEPDFAAAEPERIVLAEPEPGPGLVASADFEALVAIAGSSYSHIESMQVVRYSGFETSAVGRSASR